MNHQKQCTRCGVSKALDAFVRDSRNKTTGRAAACKDCQGRWRGENANGIRAQRAAAYLQRADARREASRRYAASNREKRASAHAAWYTKNADRVRDLERARYRANAEDARARSREWHRANPEKSRARQKTFLATNPGYKRSHNAKRRAQELRATPGWANQFFIEEAYRLAKQRESVCGGVWHVDHIVPLQSPVVCGLHVEHNLQVIPGRLNLEKSNRYWPDMPDQEGLFWTS